MNSSMPIFVPKRVVAQACVELDSLVDVERSVRNEAAGDGGGVGGDFTGREDDEGSGPPDAAVAEPAVAVVVQDDFEFAAGAGGDGKVLGRQEAVQQAGVDGAQFGWGGPESEAEEVPAAVDDAQRQNSVAVGVDCAAHDIGVRHGVAFDGDEDQPAGQTVAGGQYCAQSVGKARVLYWRHAHRSGGHPAVTGGEQQKGGLITAVRGADENEGRISLWRGRQLRPRAAQWQVPMSSRSRHRGRCG